MKAYRSQHTENQRLRQNLSVTEHLGYLLSLLVAFTSLAEGQGEKILDLSLFSMSLLILLATMAFKIMPLSPVGIPRRIFQQLFTYTFLTAVSILACGEAQSPLYYLFFLIIINATFTLQHRLSAAQIIIISGFMLTVGLMQGGSWYNSFQFLVFRLVPFWAVTYFVSEIFRQLKEDRKLLEQISETDDLTGLYNMRRFTEILDMEMLRSARYRRPFSLLMLDADNLKSVNDNYGHMAGSRYICSMADILLGQLRKTDLIARYGGDEFIVLLPETYVNDSRMVGERICRAVEDSYMDIHGVRIQRTVSIGVSGYPNDAATVNDLIRNADAALYEGKRRGKNQVCCFHELQNG